MINNDYLSQNCVVTKKMICLYNKLRMHCKLWPDLSECISILYHSVQLTVLDLYVQIIITDNLRRKKVKRTCKQCGKEFVITGSEIQFYRSKNLSIPKRCKDCRTKNKQDKEADVYKKRENIQNKIIDGPQENSDFYNNTQKSKKSKYLGYLLVIIAILLIVIETRAARNDSSNIEKEFSLQKEIDIDDGESKAIEAGSEVEANDEQDIDSKQEIEAELEVENKNDTKTSEYQGIETNEIEVDENVDVEKIIADESDNVDIDAYYFRNREKLEEHYQKHGIEMGFTTAKEYEAAASAVVNNPNSLFKTESEDGDLVYYLEETNEIVIISPEGFIRTYFNPDRGIDYFNGQ